jgi:hypothetical protein
MLGYGAIDIVDEHQSETVRALLTSLAELGLLMWEWADSAVADCAGSPRLMGAAQRSVVLPWKVAAASTQSHGLL